MEQKIVLLRGINVGGKNKVPMAALKKCLTDLGYDDVVTYIASGNVLVRSNKKPDAIKKEVEAVLPKHFRLDTDLLKVLVLTGAELRRVVAKKPKGFGDSPTKYHSDVIFLIGFPVPEALKSFKPKEGVDRVWPGPGAIYSARLSAKRTQSRLNRVMGTPSYQHMTIRNWNTVTKLVSLLDK
jgi:uncharacterized protein (DUF1697 family)